MPPHQLGHDRVGDVSFDRVALSALGRDPRMEHHLQQIETFSRIEKPWFMAAVQAACPSWDSFTL
jgi:hypothetical protein